jgi:hypothetical protein
MEMSQADAQARIDRILKQESPGVVEDEQKPGSPATTTTPQTPQTPNSGIFAAQVPTAAFADVNGKKRYVGNVGIKVK